MASDAGFRSDRLLSARTDRAIWVGLTLAAGIGLSGLYACATPFAAVAAIAGLKLDWRSMIVSVGLVWLGNQAIGFGLLGYPWTPDCAAWGLAIGIASGLSVLAAAGLSPTRSAPLAVSLPFVAAFATFEFALYLAGFVLGAEDGAFSFSVVWHIFTINAVALCGVMAVYNLICLGVRLLGGTTDPRIADGASSLR